VVEWASDTRVSAASMVRGSLLSLLFELLLEWSCSSRSLLLFAASFDWFLATRSFEQAGEEEEDEDEDKDEVDEDDEGDEEDEESGTWFLADGEQDDEEEAEDEDFFAGPSDGLFCKSFDFKEIII
jgi:hypothetical protein